MVLHFLKVAIHNLLAHKTQTLVSLFGLAIAFTCMSLATYWNYYERTYDAFQENADRIYRIRCKSFNTNGVESKTPYPLHLYLKENYPEVESACVIQSSKWTGVKVSANGITYPSEIFSLRVNPEALDIFNIEWVEGNKEIMTYQKNQIAISDKLAQVLYKDQSPVGQPIKIVGEYEVMGVYKARPQHSNIKVDFIQPLVYKNGWNVSDCYTYVLLKEGVNHELFIQKMRKDSIKQHLINPRDFGIVTPLAAMRQDHPDREINVAFEDVNLFTMAAVILSLCALLNYLTLFVSRLRVRGRDMALRAICGSSGWQLNGLFLTEYLLLLLSASLLGMLFVELVMQKFMELAMIEIEFSSVLVSCGYLMLSSVVLSVLLSVVPILYFKRKTLKVQIEVTPTLLRKNHFRSIGVCIQLVVGMLFIFCTAIMMKQVYMTTNLDNIKRKQIAWVTFISEDHDVVKGVLLQQPYITQTLDIKPLYPAKAFPSTYIENWDGKSSEDSKIICEQYGLNDEIAEFYSLKMKEGSSTFELNENEVFINETLAKRMNLDHPIGKNIFFHDKYSCIKGVICDYLIQNPNTPPNPVLYTPAKTYKGYIAFKYDGDWKDCKEKLTEEIRKKGVIYIDFADGEEHYQACLKSEYNLLKLLGVITIASILIAIFGIYALIMQSCDQHQKEIAVRKVFGAQVVDILLMFFKQYMIQVVVAAVIAFPVGYYLMKNWLQQYARQTEISFWIYLAIFVGISLLVTLCIGWRVWKAANENPAAVIKKE